MSLARKILENTFVQVLGKLITAGFSIVVLKVISGYLGTAGYGDYTTVYQFLALFGIMADFGIYTITVKEMSKDESRIPWILANTMGLRTLLTVISMIFAVVVVYALPTYRGTLVPMGVVIATLVTFFTILNGTVSSVLQVYLKMGYATIALVIGKMVSVVYMLWVAYVAYTHASVEGFNQLMWSGVAGNAAMFFITAWYVKRYTPITYRFDWAYYRRMFLESLPYGVALVLNTIYFRLDVILMTFLLPHTQTLANGSVFCAARICSDTEIGLYGVGQRMLEMLVIVPVYFMNSALPVMSRFIQEQSRRIHDLLQYSFDFLTATSMPILVGAYILAVPIVLFVSSPEYISGNVYVHGSDFAVQLLMFAMVFSFLNTLFGFTLVVLSRQVHLMYINAAGLLFNFVANMLVIPEYGFRAAAVTTMISELFILFFTYRGTQKAIGFRLTFRTLGKTIFSSLLMGVFLFFGIREIPHLSHLLQLAILVPSGILIYAFFMWITGAVSPEMLALLKRRDS